MADEGGHGVPGLALAGAALGFGLIWSAITNVKVTDFFRAVLRGEPPPKGRNSIQQARDAVSAATAAEGLRPATGGTATGSAVAAKASTYVGQVPYVWAGETPDGWDCSGFVTWVLHHDFGMDLPDNVHTVTGQFMTWPGAKDIPRESCAPGDLVCWWSHIGIAVDNVNMVNAANPADGTLISPIWVDLPPVIRRPIAYGGLVENPKGA